MWKTPGRGGAQIICKRKAGEGAPQQPATKLLELARGLELLGDTYLNHAEQRNCMPESFLNT
jgi:hypothetical protein